MSQDAGTGRRSLLRPRKPRQTRPPESDGAFPDLPEPFVPQRVDGTGALDEGDIETLQRTGSAQLVAPESRKRAGEGADLLAQKLRQLQAGYNAGIINQAQFEALSERYIRQKSVMELIAQNPSEATPDLDSSMLSTDKLWDEHAATPLGMVVIDQRTRQTLREFGLFQLPAGLLGPHLEGTEDPAGAPGIHTTQIERGRWLTLICGAWTVSAVIFSREPAARQEQQFAMLHQQMETRNSAILSDAPVDVSLIVFPQASWFGG